MFCVSVIAANYKAVATKGYRQTNGVAEVALVRSSIHCASVCVINNWCRSFNIKVKNGQLYRPCELLNITGAEMQITADSEFYLYELDYYQYI